MGSSFDIDVLASAIQISISFNFLLKNFRSLTEGHTILSVHLAVDQAKLDESRQILLEASG